MRRSEEPTETAVVPLRRVATHGAWAFIAILGVSACGGTEERPGEPESPERNGMDEAMPNEPGAQDDTAQNDGANDDGVDEPDVEKPDTEDPTTNTPPDPMQAMLSEYRSWQQRTDAPINVSSDIFTLCRSPSLAENAFVASEHGDGLMLMDWLNPEARAGFESLGADDFAAGAAIVKEKLAYVDGSAEPVLVAIGMMLKHEPGFDAEHDDWEFAYWEESPGLIDGPDQSAYCADCHSTSPTDYVFLDDSWRDDP